VIAGARVPDSGAATALLASLRPLSLPKAATVLDLFNHAGRRARRVLRTLLLAGEADPERAFEKYVFVVTYGRSGSTLVQKLIGGLPGYHIRGENRDALRGLVRSYKAAATTKDDYGAKPKRPDDPWYGAFEVDPKRYGRRLARQFVEEILAPPPNARVVGFKEIRYFNDLPELEDYIGFMREFFAPARFVFNVRDPAAVAQSSWWKDHPAEEIVPRVAGWNRIIETYVDAHPRDCLLLHYDAFVAEPEQLRDLFEFLGEPFDPRYVRQVLQQRLLH
jgi:hypothetical protein